MVELLALDGVMTASRRNVLGSGFAVIVSAAGGLGSLGTSPPGPSPLDAVSNRRRQDALAFVKSVNKDFHRAGLPPLSDGYVTQALGQAAHIMRGV